MRKIIICLLITVLAACSPSGPNQVQIQACPDEQQPRHIAAFDLHDNGTDQLVVSCSRSLQVFSLNESAALEPVQALHFEHGVLNAVAWPQTNGREGLVFAGSEPEERSLSYVRVDQMGQLTDPVLIHTGSGESTRMVISDVDGDGHPDIVMPDLDVWLENLGSDAEPGPFRSQPIEPGVEWRRIFGKVGTRAGQARPAGTYIRAADESVRIFSRLGVEDFPTGVQTEDLLEVLAAGDMNGDDIPDLIVTVQAAPVENTVHVLLSSGSGQWELTDQVADLINPAAIILDDFSGDGRIDLLMAPIAMPGQDRYRLTLVSGLSGAEHDQRQEIAVHGFPYRMIPFRSRAGSPTVAFVDQESNRLSVLHW